MPHALTPQAFVAKWRRSELKESAADREHFIDLCRLIGHETPAEADSTGAAFTFQYGASKLDGKQGFADVFKRGRLRGLRLAGRSVRRGDPGTAAGAELGMG